MDFSTAEIEPMFFISTLGLSFELPIGFITPSSYFHDPFVCTDIFGSHLICPFSMSASDIPKYLAICLTFEANSFAWYADLIFGLVTNSMSGIPDLL